MEQVLDQPLLQPNVSNVKYGGFWIRFGALIIDGLVLAPVTIGVTFLNVTSWKSPMLFLLATLLSMAYKPFMEFAYGATLGKMALNLKVVNLKLERATLGEILMRNIFNIVPSLITLVLTIGLYSAPEFEEISGYGDYTEFIAGSQALQMTNIFIGLITIADAIALLADKYNRSLHDRIGGTYVIEK